MGISKRDQILANAFVSDRYDPCWIKTQTSDGMIILMQVSVYMDESGNFYRFSEENYVVPFPSTREEELEADVAYYEALAHDIREEDNRGWKLGYGEGRLQTLKTLGLCLICGDKDWKCEKCKEFKDGSYEDTRYCDHCEQDTIQRCFESNHERDSSGNWRKCGQCGWFYSGITGEYEPYPQSDEELLDCGCVVYKGYRCQTHGDP